MKRATAFILSIVYLAFAFGGANTGTDMPGMEYAYVMPASENDEVNNVSVEKAGPSDIIETASFVKKVHQHLATVAKVKLPRPAFFANTSFTDFVPEHHAVTGTHQINTGTPLWAPAALYLKNNIFLI